MQDIDFSLFEKKIGVTFKDKQLLRQAFLHRSYLNEHPKETLHHNERLEFLGDAVLELVVTTHLFNTFGDKPEGELTVYRAALVNTQSISSAATRLMMGDFLLLSKGERRDVGKARHSILANTFEAVIGALYLDLGYDVAKEFIKDALFHTIDTIVEEHLWQDAKSRFQEKAQEIRNITPSYEILKESGPDHARHFIIGAYIGDEQIGKGEGDSKQEAEQAAAHDALNKNGWK